MPAIRPDNTPTPSPIWAFAECCLNMSKQRAALVRIPFPSHNEESRRQWRILLEDLDMLMADDLVIGIRTPWVRRVVVPIVLAQRMLCSKDPDRRVKAAEILAQCGDAELRERCLHWLTNEVITAPADPQNRFTFGGIIQ